MDNLLLPLDENLKTIIQVLQLNKESDCESNSREVFTVLELLTDFFSTFQLTNSHNSNLFGLFLAIQAQCISVFSSQGIFSLPQLSHFWAFFASEFLNQTENLSNFDFSPYLTQIQTNLFPFVNNLPLNESRQLLIQLLQQFIQDIENYQKSKSKTSQISDLMSTFLQLKRQFFAYITVSDSIQKDFINFFLSFEYALTNYNLLIKIRESIQNISKNGNSFPINKLNYADTIRNFSEKCLRFLILEIQSIIEFADESQRLKFYQICSEVENIIASSKLFMNQRIIQKWNEFIPLLRSLSITIDQAIEKSEYKVIFSNFDKTTQYNFARDEICSLISNGVPSDFKSIYRLYCLLIVLKQRTDDQDIIPHIENLLHFTSARLFHSKIIYDQQHLDSLFMRLDKEPTGFDTVLYLKNSLLQLVTYNVLPSPETNTQMWLLLSLIDSISIAGEAEWTKYIPKSDEILYLLSIDREHQLQIKDYLAISEEATHFTDHLFMDEFDISHLPDFYKFGERQIQLATTTKPNLIRNSMVFEVFSLVDAIHDKYGSMENKLRVDLDESDKSTILITQIHKIIHNNLFSPDEEKLIARDLLPLMVYLLYDNDEDDTFLQTFFTNSANAFVPRCCDLLAECYDAFECFDNWRNLHPDQLNEVFQDTLTLFNSFFSDTKPQIDFNQSKIKARFSQIIQEVDPKLLDEFQERFTVIEKYAVMGSMIRIIIRNVCNFNKDFPLAHVDEIKIITQVNYLRLIEKCINKIINIPDAVIHSEQLDHFLEQLDPINKSNSPIDLIEYDLDSIIDEFSQLEIINPHFIHNYFNCVCHFLLQQINASSILYSSNAQKRQEFKDVSELLSQFGTFNDHFKLMFALNKLKSMIDEGNQNKSNCSIYLFNSTIQQFLDQIYPMHTLFLMKAYKKKNITEDSSKIETQKSIFDSVISQIDDMLNEQSDSAEVNSSLEKIKQQMETMKKNNFDEQYKTIQKLNPAEYSPLDRLKRIRSELYQELEIVHTPLFTDDCVRAKSEESLLNLESTRSKIAAQIEEQRQELKLLKEQYEELQSRRAEQSNSIDNDESEEHNKMSILQFIINSDFDPMQFEQRVVHPNIVFLHDQLKDATIANARLTCELNNKKFRMEKPQIPHSTMSEIFHEAPQGRNWLSNDATNAMSLRGSLKILEEQRKESFREYVDAKVQKEQQRMKAVAPKLSESLASNSLSVNEYLSKLDRIAASAKIRKDYGAIREEFGQVADKLFFTLEEEMKELRNQIQVRKKYGEDIKEIRIKNLENLLKI